jgi:microcin C transport system permease protein
MSADTIPPPVTPASPATRSTLSLSPNQRAWARFRRNRLGFVSLILFCVMLGVSTIAELVSNDRPLIAQYNGRIYFPLFDNQPETRFGGDFKTPTDWHDRFIREQFAKPATWRCSR